MFLSNAKRDWIKETDDARWSEMAPKPILTSQDFFDTIDTRTVLVNGEIVPIVTKVDYDVVGAAIGDSTGSHARFTEDRSSKPGHEFSRNGGRIRGG